MSYNQAIQKKEWSYFPVKRHQGTGAVVPPPIKALFKVPGPVTYSNWLKFVLANDEYMKVVISEIKTEVSALIAYDKGEETDTMKKHYRKYMCWYSPTLVLSFLHYFQPVLPPVLQDRLLESTMKPFNIMLFAFMFDMEEASKKISTDDDRSAFDIFTLANMKPISDFFKLFIGKNGYLVETMENPHARNLGGFDKNVINVWMGEVRGKESVVGIKFKMAENYGNGIEDSRIRSLKTQYFINKVCKRAFYLQQPTTTLRANVHTSKLESKLMAPVLVQEKDYIRGIRNLAEVVFNSSTYTYGGTDLPFDTRTPPTVYNSYIGAAIALLELSFGSRLAGVIHQNILTKPTDAEVVSAQETFAVPADAFVHISGLSKKRSRKQAEARSYRFEGGKLDEKIDDEKWERASAYAAKRADHGLVRPFMWFAYKPKFIGINVEIDLSPLQVMYSLLRAVRRSLDAVQGESNYVEYGNLLVGVPDTYTNLKACNHIQPKCVRPISLAFQHIPKLVKRSHEMRRLYVAFTWYKYSMNGANEVAFSKRLLGTADLATGAHYTTLRVVDDVIE
jgi:hypothetical protein